MDIIRVNNKGPACGLEGQPRHPIKIHQECKEDFVCGRTVAKYAKEISLKGNGGDVAGMEGERRGRVCKGGAGSGCEGTPYGSTSGIFCWGRVGERGKSVGRVSRGQRIVGGSDLGKQGCKQPEQVRWGIRVDVDGLRGGHLKRRVERHRNDRVICGWSLGGGVCRLVIGGVGRLCKIVPSRTWIASDGGRARGRPCGGRGLLLVLLYWWLALG